MKIYDWPYAPNPRKLRVYLAEKGIDMDFELVDITKGEQHKTGFLRMNPMGAVPVLALDDDTYLTESLPIIEYFEELHPDPPMIGRDPLERARVREMERLIESGLMNRIGRIFFNESPIFKHTGQLPDVAAKARDELPGVLEIVDAKIGSSMFAAGDTPSIADCTLFATIRHAKVAGVEIGDRYENLMGCYQRFRARPSAEAVLAIRV
jgi:glutathione S-transferase